MPARWQELPRSAAPIAKIGSKGPPDRAARTLPQPNLRSAPSGGSPSYRFTDARRFSPGPSMIIRSTQTPTDRMNRKMTSEHSSRARGKLKIGEDSFHALALRRLIQPPIAEEEIAAKEKDIKRKLYLRNAAVPRRFERCSHVAWRRLDSLAGVGGLELRNVVSKYPFERLHRFPGSSRISGHRDYSRSSCDGGRRSLRTRSTGTDIRPETFVVRSLSRPDEIEQVGTYTLIPSLNFLQK